MVDILQSSVTVSFGESNKTSSGDLIWERDGTRTSAEDRELYLRLYPEPPEVLIVTSGSIVKKGGDVADITDLIVFSGDTEQSIRYPKVSDVAIQAIGSAYDSNGDPITVTFSYNAAMRSIIASESCYGVVEVTYQAPYTVYLYSFSGDPCELKLIGGQLVQTGGYNPAYITALNPVQDATASIQLTPDVCGFSGGVKHSGDDSGPVNIVLEIHKDFPPRVTGSSAIQGTKVGCKVRQIPAVDADIDLSSGSYSPEEFNTSGDKADRDSKVFFTNNYVPKYTETVKGMLQFNVAYSAKLQYQPSGNINITPTGPFLNKWGNTVSPSFAKPGDTILEVEWINEHTYRNPRERIVKEDEIVALTTGNKTVDIYGSAKIEYSIQYKVFDVNFRLINYERPEDGYETIHMTANYEGQTEYLMIEPPSMKEK